MSQSQPCWTPSAAPAGKLEIGSGEYPCEGGFTHNDLVAYPHIELVEDGSQLSVESDSLCIVRAVHVLEHFAPTRAVCALREWRRVLVRDGILELALPNGQLIVELWQQEQLTYAAMIRDMLGLPPESLRLPTLEEFRRAWRTHGWSAGLKGWLYGRTNALPHGKPENAQTHRWAYGAHEVAALLGEMGFYRIHVKIDGTALHAWGSKQPVRPRVGYDALQRLFAGQAVREEQ